MAMQKNIMKMHRYPYSTIRDQKNRRKLSIQCVWIAVATAHTVTAVMILWSMTPSWAWYRK